jgi:very-short-patch-repair endonuclease
VGVWQRERRLIDLAIAHERLIDRRVLEEQRIDAETWRRHLEHGCWERVAPGVWRHLATEETWHLRARATLRWLGKDAALFGPTALRWWALIESSDDEVHVVVPRRDRGHRGHRGLVVVHTTEAWRPSDFRRHDGVRLHEPAQAIVAAAGLGLSAARLESAIDEAIRRRLTSQRALTASVDRAQGAGHAGVRILRSLLLDTGGESYLERRFLALVRRARLPRPQCQVVHRADGKHIARVDFLFPGTDVVVEVSGRLGHVSDSERQSDARRRNALQRAGRVVLEFTTADVLDARDYVEVTLRDWLAPRLPFS